MPIFSMQQPNRSCALPALMEELVEEILLRLPPEEPAHLVRCAMVCKAWRRILSDGGFRRRYRRFHRATPPTVLGYVCGVFMGGPHTTGKRLIAARQNVCRALFIGRTANIDFTVRFLEDARQQKTHGT
jgi:hypothetical protein